MPLKAHLFRLERPVDSLRVSRSVPVAADPLLHHLFVVVLLLLEPAETATGRDGVSHGITPSLHEGLGRFNEGTRDHVSRGLRLKAIGGFIAIPLTRSCTPGVRSDIVYQVWQYVRLSSPHCTGHSAHRVLSSSSTVWIHAEGNTMIKLKLLYAMFRTKPRDRPTREYATDKAARVISPIRLLRDICAGDTIILVQYIQYSSKHAR